MRITPLLLLPLAACLDSTPELGEARYAVDGGVTTTPMALDAAAILQGATAGSATPICSGTFISDQWVLTARSCNVSANGSFFVGSYTDPNGFSTVHSIALVVHPSGTSENDWIDSDGNFADFTLVKIVGVHGGTVPPTLAWSYSNNLHGYLVGNGNHNLTPGDNDAGQLRTAPTTTYQQNSSGAFLTTLSWTAGLGDQGGPFYVGLFETSNVMLGVLSNHYFFNGWMRDRFTSIPFHLGFILNAMSWIWPGTSPQLNKRAIGSLLTTVTQSHLGCQYACKNTTPCVAYNHNSLTHECRLYSTQTGTITSLAWTTASLP